MYIIKSILFLVIVLFIDVETIEVKSEESSKVSNSDPTKLDLLEALFYPIFKRTTVEEERAPVFKNVLPMLTTIAEQNQNLKNQQNFLDNQRKKRSIGLPIRPLSPVAKGNRFGYGYGGYGGYGGNGYGPGYGYVDPYIYGGPYGIGYGNYGYGYGNQYYDPYCL